jgi:hypothetical protein
MAPFVERMRLTPADGASVDLDLEGERFNYLAQANYKFYSHGRATMRPGDRVLHILLQPEIRKGQLAVFGYSISKRLSPAHLTILTDTELILIREDDTQFWLKGPPHGAIWSYVPRSMIESAALVQRNHDLITREIKVRGDIALSSTFDSGAEADLQRLVRQVRI